MSNGEVCCILGVCCPAGSAEQRQALIHMIQKERQRMSDADAAAAAHRVLEAHGNFEDVAELIDQPA